MHLILEKIALPGYLYSTAFDGDRASDEEKEANLADVPEHKRATAWYGLVENPEGYDTRDFHCDSFEGGRVIEFWHNPIDVRAFLEGDFPSSLKFRSDRLWFPNANVVIRVPDGCVAFRVHGETLAAISSRPLAGSHEILDGCPVMYLVKGPTEAEALHFLSAVFIPEYFDAVLNHEITFDAIAAVYKLSGVYEIPTLRQKSLILLSDAFPSSLFDLITGPTYNTLSHAREQPANAIHFARHGRLDWILPFAYYRYCIELGTSTKWLKLDGDIDPLLFVKAEHEMNTANLPLVQERDGRQRLIEPVGCTGGTRCQLSRLRESAWLFETMNIFRAWVPEPGSALCASCWEEIAGWHDARREAFWISLPGMFGLPGWTRLIAMREARLRP
ncbi:hypothetical protein FB45DRAFT_1059790 [Roridomyces roridus]|uniref:Uncharacterized protein n=1 Tax=Roridomyces roridus TaxID=1738132 RepID=A0AAD7BPA3_9AGAR|nr:hypothetical protein FB45DRAFT_1059790 [Roridomyces roridus]